MALLNKLISKVGIDLITVLEAILMGIAKWSEVSVFIGIQWQTIFILIQFYEYQELRYWSNNCIDQISGMQLCQKAPSHIFNFPFHLSMFFFCKFVHGLQAHAISNVKNV